MCKYRKSCQQGTKGSHPNLQSRRIRYGKEYSCHYEGQHGQYTKNPGQNADYDS